MILFAIMFIIIMIIIIAIAISNINNMRHNNDFHKNNFSQNIKDSSNIRNSNTLNKNEANLSNYSINNEYINKLSPEDLNKLLSTLHPDYTKIYEKKEYLLTKQELKFFRLIKPISNKHNLNLFTQVALYEIVKNKELKDFNKIKSKTIDFVLTDSSCRILVCIELDDYTHNREDRKKRDLFINDLFNQLNIGLLRVPVQNYYNMSKIEEKLITYLPPATPQF